MCSPGILATSGFCNRRDICHINPELAENPLGVKYLILCIWIIFSDIINNYRYQFHSSAQPSSFHTKLSDYLIILFHFENYYSGRRRRVEVWALFFLVFFVSRLSRTWYMLHDLYSTKQDGRQDFSMRKHI